MFLFYLYELMVSLSYNKRGRSWDEDNDDDDDEHKGGKDDKV